MTSYIEEKKFYAIAIDPIHIGSGEYKLGIVDNSIIRESSTELPIIPGTSVAGVIREYFTLYLMENYNEIQNKPDIEKRPLAEKKAIQFFGNEDSRGLLRFYDARILFFPVSSVEGTIWITTKDVLEFIGLKGKLKDEIEKINENEAYLLKGIEIDSSTNNRLLNFGWLLFEIKEKLEINEVFLPAKIDDLIKRIVILPPQIFSHIINDNLEVRTSVKINPETGTAQEGALFTYEAIPRSTIFGFEILMDKNRSISNNINSLLVPVFPYLRLLGIGGMITRGFGRLDILDMV